MIIQVLFVPVYLAVVGNSLTTLTILHVNDIHSHFEEVSVNTARCRDKEQGCYGGVSRIASIIQQVRESDPDALVLNAGDVYQGTIWYSLFKYEPVVEFSNLLNFTAIALGNHDWDDGPNGLKPFLDQANCPILAANVYTKNLLGIKRSTIVKVGGVRVGIIGYVTDSTPTLSQPGRQVVFADPISSVRVEAGRLKQLGVNIIIATGHSGYDVDMEMASSIPDLDLVVGGHSHTFLYTGRQPSVETPRGPYPTYIEQEGGKIVPVVQAYCYTKYMGLLTLQFTESGELVLPPVFAQPLLLDNSIPKLGWVEEKLNPWRKLLKPYTTPLAYNTHTMYTADNTETTIGNAITDSMAAAWPGRNIALINDGGIRTQLEKGIITGEDIYNVLPFNNTVDHGCITGRGLLAALEEGLQGLCPQADCQPREFYQMSGLRAQYTIRENNTGHRVTNLEYLTPQGSYELVDPGTVYPLVTVSFLLLPGKSRLASEIQDRIQGPGDYQVFKDYVERNTPLDQKLEGRIKIHYIKNHNKK